MAIGFAITPVLGASGEQASQASNQGEITPIDAVPASDPDDGELLATGDYLTRQQKTLDLWRHRARTREIVREAVRDADPEVSGRARWVLDQWRRGILPDTPKELAERLRSADAATAMSLLLAAGRFDAAVIALEESVGTPTWELLRDRAATSIEVQFPSHIRSAVEDESLPAFLELIDLVARTTQMAACRVELMREMGLPIDEQNLLPSSSEDWPPALKTRATVQALVTMGRIDDAIKFLSESALVQTEGDRIAQPAESQQSLREDLLRVCQMIDGRWEELCDDLIAMEESEDWASVDKPRFYSQLLIAADRSRNDGARQRAVEKLRAGFENAESNSQSQFRWGTLAAHGEVDAALEILSGDSPEQAASLARGASRYGFAFDCFGRSLSSPDQAVQSVLDKIDDQAEAGHTFNDDELQELRYLVRDLLWIGRGDLAWSLCQHLVQVKQLGVNSGRLMVAYYLLLAGNESWVMRFAGSGDSKLSDSIQRLLANLVDGIAVDQNMWARIDVILSKLRPEASAKQRTTWTLQFCQGILPKEFDRSADLDKFYRLLLEAPRSTQERLFRQPISRDSISIAFAEFFRQLGRDDLSDRCYLNLEQRGDAQACFELAQRAHQVGRHEAADKWLDRLQQLIDARSRVGFVGRGSGGLVDLSIKVPIIRWLSAQLSGDESRAQQGERLIRYMLCSPTPDHRRTAIEFMIQNDIIDLAQEAYSPLLSLTVLESGEATTFSSVAHAYAMQIHEDQPAAAARWLDLSVIALIQVPGRSAFTFSWYPMLVEGFRLEAAVKANDEELARNAIVRSIALDPMHIDHAESVLPKVRDAGMTELADEFMRRLTYVGREHFREVPSDVVMFNNLAWVLAVNDHDLDQALIWSRRAVALEPDSAIYRDTLAEILFRLGRVDEAIQVEEACLLDTPADHHLHKQLARFRRQEP